VEVVKGEVLVRFSGDNPLIPPLEKGGFDERVTEELEKFNKEKGTLTLKSYEKIGVHRFKISATETVQEFIERHLDAKQVYIEPVFLTNQQAIVVNDPSFRYQWAIPQIQADKAWEINSGSPDTIVAVIDTGIDITHLDLKNRVISGVDIIDGDSSGVDDNGHGTYVAGIIAAEANNSIGIAGVSYISNYISSFNLRTGRDERL
jgi:subtilisin family serine protease